MARYRKAIVAVIGAIATIPVAAQGGSPWIAVCVSACSAIIVLLTPNRGK